MKQWRCSLSVDDTAQPMLQSTLSKSLRDDPSIYGVLDGGPQRLVSNLRNGHVVSLFFPALSILRNGCVALSNLRVKGHICGTYGT